ICRGAKLLSVDEEWIARCTDVHPDLQPSSPSRGERFLRKSSAQTPALKSGQDGNVIEVDCPCSVSLEQRVSDKFPAREETPTQVGGCQNGQDCARILLHLFGIDTPLHLREKSRSAHVPSERSDLYGGCRERCSLQLDRSVHSILNCTLNLNLGQ